MAVRLLTTSLRPAFRQMSTSSTKKKGRIIEVEPITLIEKCVPAVVILGFVLITDVPRESQRGVHGDGWLGETFWRLYGKLFVYRRKIREEIKEQKQKDYAEGKEWPWRIWVG